MTGFAAVAPLYDTSKEGYSAQAFRSLSLILMASRLLLVLQYGLVLWYIRGYRNAFMPVALTIAILATSTIIFLGLFFCFTEGSSRHAYIGWYVQIHRPYPSALILFRYVVVVIEAIAVVTVSSIWSVLSFNHTHLVERNGTLTLIIVGEGIVGMTKSVSTIVTGSAKLTGNDIGTIVAAVLVLVSI